MKLQVKDLNGKSINEIEVVDKFLNEDFNQILLKEVFEYERSNKRAATYGTKCRGELSFSTRKVYRQKGTGNARIGPRGAPHHRKGGVCFGPDGRIYKYTMPKQKITKAIAIAFSQLNKEGNLIIINDFKFNQVKTKDFLKVIDNLNINNGCLFIDNYDSDFKNLHLSMRNVIKQSLVTINRVNLINLMKSSKVAITTSAIKAMEKRYV